MALTVPPVPLATATPLAGWLILAGLLIYGGSSLWEDVQRALGFASAGDDGPVVSLPAALVLLGVGLTMAAWFTRR